MPAHAGLRPLYAPAARKSQAQIVAFPARPWYRRDMILALAPMQDVTDLAFVRTLARIGSLPDFLVTPYFRSTATTCAMADENLRCIRENESGCPIHAQLAGSDAAALVRDATELMKLPVAGINLNAGCPSPLVNRHGAGAALLRDLENFREILLRLRDAVPEGKFSVKCRIGWQEPDEFDAILPVLAEARPDMVMIHLRTRAQLYAGKPHWYIGPRAVQDLQCPVLLNGDMQTHESVLRTMEVAECAGVMLGRGAVRNPYLFRMVRGGGAPTRDEMHAYYETLIEETGRILPEGITQAGHCNRMKKYLAFCYQDFSDGAEYALRRCIDIAQMRAILARQ